MNEFLIELAALLTRHNASIGWDCDDCSDMHGIFGEGMVVTVGTEQRSYPGCWDIDASDCCEGVKLI